MGGNNASGFIGSMGGNNTSGFIGSMGDNGKKYDKKTGRYQRKHPQNDMDELKSIGGKGLLGGK